MQEGLHQIKSFLCTVLIRSGEATKRKASCKIIVKRHDMNWAQWGFNVALTLFHSYWDLEAGDNQSLTSQWWDLCSNPVPLAPQAKSLTTKPPILLDTMVIDTPFAKVFYDLLGENERSLSVIHKGLCRNPQCKKITLRVDFWIFITLNVNKITLNVKKKFLH